MRIDDLHLLPRLRDSASFLYLERGRIEQDGRSVRYVNERERVPIPVASLTLLLLGPGTTITQQAVRNIAECGCTIAWSGEDGVRLYANGLGETRSARRLIRQARLVSDPRLRMQVVRRMYELRFEEPLPRHLSLQQIRGLEGVRVRETYARLSRETKVPWSGRSYRRHDWRAADPVNRALSAANACLYGICHAAVVSAGYSPALGFVHTGKALSFVYDVADLYKTETSIPAAFHTVGDGEDNVERAVRIRLRDQFHRTNLLGRIVEDLARLLDVDEAQEDAVEHDMTAPGGLWDPGGVVAGGVNHGVDL